MENSIRQRLTGPSKPLITINSDSIALEILHRLTEEQGRFFYFGERRSSNIWDTGLGSSPLSVWKAEGLSGESHGPHRPKCIGHSPKGASPINSWILAVPFHIPSPSPHGSRQVKTELWSFFRGGHRPRESKWTTASYLILGAFSSFFLFLFSLFILASQWVMLQCWQMICPGITSTWAKNENITKHRLYFSFQNNLCSKKKAGDFIVEMTNCLRAL